MKNDYAFILVIFCLFCTTAMTAQITYGVYANYATPTGELSKNIDNPVGLSLDIGFPIKKIPGLYLGAELGVAMYANDKYQLSNEEETKTFEVREEDCYVAYHATAKYFVLKKQKRFNPYLEGKIGGLSYFSDMTSDEKDFDSKTAFHGSALNVGLGGGVLFNVVKNLSINAAAVYSQGGKADYRTIDKSDRIKKGLEEGLRNAHTNFIQFKLGITIGFNTL